MGRKFVIVADSKDLLPEHRNRITAHLREKQWGYWHWFADVWLLANAPDDFSAEEIWKSIDGVFAEQEKPSVLVLDTQGENDYFGRGPEGMWPWFLRKWK